MQPTIPLTYEQALVAPRVFENNSYRYDNGYFCEVWSCLNCTTWGDQDCINYSHGHSGQSITEFITEDEPNSNRPMVWKVVRHNGKELYVKFDGVLYEYLNGDVRSNGTIYEVKDLHPEIQHLIYVYG